MEQQRIETCSSSTFPFQHKYKMFAHSKAWREGLYFQGEVEYITIQEMFLILDYFSITKDVMVCNRTLNKFLSAYFLLSTSVNNKGRKDLQWCGD